MEIPMRDPVRTIYEKSGDRSYLPRHSMSGLTIPLRLFSWSGEKGGFMYIRDLTGQIAAKFLSHLAAKAL